jgi:hypothetical protein
MNDDASAVCPRARFRLLPERTSDDEYIERITKNLRFLDRWWWVVFGLSLSGLTVVCWMAVMAVELVRGMLELAQKANLIPNANLNALPEGLVFAGASVGFTIGMGLHTFCSGLFLLLQGHRTERLLVRLHAEARREVAPDDDEEGS